MFFSYPAAGAEINSHPQPSPAIKFTAALSFIGIVIAGVFLFSFFPPAYPPVSPGSNWKPADIAFLNPRVDMAYPLVAIYARKTGPFLLIRLDFIPEPLEKINIDLFNSSRSEKITAVVQNGKLAVQPAGFQPFFSFAPMDNEQDTLILTVTGTDLARYPENWIIRVGTLISTDLQIKPVFPETALFSSNPLIPANVVIGFWNTLPAASPSQLLRRWDGAHTGPFGQRHGLSQVITQSSLTRIPVVLLDLAQPASLSGLDLLQETGTIKTGLSSGLLVLPAPSDTPASSKAEISTNWAVYRSQLVYNPAINNPAFSPGICTYSSRCLSLDPQDDLPEKSIGRFGLTPFGKLGLITALSPYSTDHPLVLGGDLAASPWGDSFSAPAAFRYLADHPWIKVWDAYDINNFLRRAPLIKNTSGNFLSPENSKDLLYTPTSQSAHLALINSPGNPLTSLAWNTYLSLTSRPASPALAALRAHYFVEIGRLLMASRWAQNPLVQNQPTQLGPDRLYILSDPGHFLLLDLSGATMVLAASQKSASPQLVIAPSSLFAVGLGDPDAWTDRGLQSDPAVISEAFSGPISGVQNFQASPITNGVRFSDGIGDWKSYILNGDRLEVEIYSKSGYKTAVPLALRPEEWIQPGYRTYLESLSGNAPVRVQASVPLSQTWFFESLNTLGQPENPDHEYPPGHFLPIPTGIINLVVPPGQVIQFSMKLGWDN